MESVSYKYHGEVKSSDGRVRINVFADALDALFQDVGTVYEYLGGDITSTPILVNQPKKQQAKTQPAPVPSNGKKPPSLPSCINPECNAGSQSIELVKWTDKTNGAPRSAYKCQSCGTWIK